MAVKTILDRLVGHLDIDIDENPGAVMHGALFHWYPGDDTSGTIIVADLEADAPWAHAAAIHEAIHAIRFQLGVEFYQKMPSDQSARSICNEEHAVNERCLAMAEMLIGEGLISAEDLPKMKKVWDLGDKTYTPWRLYLSGLGQSFGHRILAPVCLRVPVLYKAVCWVYSYGLKKSQERLETLTA